MIELQENSNLTSNSNSDQYLSFGLEGQHDTHSNRIECFSDDSNDIPDSFFTSLNEPSFEPTLHPLTPHPSSRLADLKPPLTSTFKTNPSPESSVYYGLESDQYSQQPTFTAGHEPMNHEANVTHSEFESSEDIVNFHNAKPPVSTTPYYYGQNPSSVHPKSFPDFGSTSFHQQQMPTLYNANKSSVFNNTLQQYGSLTTEQQLDVPKGNFISTDSMASRFLYSADFRRSYNRTFQDDFKYSGGGFESYWSSAMRDNSDFLGKHYSYQNLPFSGSGGATSFLPDYHSPRSLERFPFLSTTALPHLPFSSGFVMDGFNPANQSCCLVCGDIAACQHYGVRSCEGCKGFFKRTTQKNTAESYICLQNKNCVMDKHRRNRCQYCRYQKCLRVGMVKDIVRSDSLKGKRGRLSSKTKTVSSDSTPSPAMSLLSLLTKAHDATQPLPNSTKIIESGQFDSNYRPVTSHSIVLSAIEKSLEIVKTFAERVPGFMQLSKNDQRTLLKWNGLDILGLRAAFRIPPSAIGEEKLAPTSLILDNGSAVCCYALTTFGLSEWTEGVFNMAGRICPLIQDDKATLAGLAALTLLSLKTEPGGRSSLESASSVHSLHHSFIEVVKSHCCTSLNSSSTPMNMTNLFTSKLSTFSSTAYNQHLGQPSSTAHPPGASSTIKDLKQPFGHGPSTANDSTLLSRILQEKRTIQRLTMTTLIPVLRQQYHVIMNKADYIVSKTNVPNSTLLKETLAMPDFLVDEMFAEKSHKSKSNHDFYARYPFECQITSAEHNFGWL